MWGVVARLLESKPIARRVAVRIPDYPALAAVHVLTQVLQSRVHLSVALRRETPTQYTCAVFGAPLSRAYKLT